jgi:copper homeostasis protein
MRDDIACAKDLGMSGVVLGLLTAEARVDVERTAELVALAHPMQVTFHRALDMARDLDAALEDVVRTGAHRVLTSGGAQNAMLGSKRAGDLVEIARGRIGVMVCGNVRPENVQQIAQVTGAREFHAALRTAVPSPVTYRNVGLNLGDAGSDEYTRNVVVAEDVRNLKSALDHALIPTR